MMLRSFRRGKFVDAYLKSMRGTLAGSRKLGNFVTLPAMTKLQTAKDLQAKIAQAEAEKASVAMKAACLPTLACSGAGAGAEDNVLRRT
jgi:predicted LPLAT superfamily acyltransferase